MALRQVNPLMMSERRLQVKYSVEFAKDVAEASGRVQVESIEFLGRGEDSEAFAINRDLVLKLPKSRKASDRLRTEMRVLRALGRDMPLRIPEVLFDGMFPAVCGGRSDGRDANGEYAYSVCTRVRGRSLNKPEFLALDEDIRSENAEIIANFLRCLHAQRDVLPVKRRDLALLHGDFSLNHVLFDDFGRVCGILDFADCRVGKPKSDFVYLLDDEDEEEFGAAFGMMVLDLYGRCR